LIEPLGGAVGLLDIDNQPLRPTQPSIRLGSVNQVLGCLAGVHLCWVAGDAEEL